MVRKSDYGPIPDEYYRSPNMKEISNIVAARGDLRRIIYLLNETPENRRAIYTEFCTNIMEEHIYDHEFRYARPFLRRIFSLKIFNLETLKHLEKVLTKADYEAVSIFLKLDFYVEVRTKRNYDILACIFGNRGFFGYPKILKDEHIDVNRRGYNGKTSLHFAAQHNLHDNVEMLLKRGADPNALDGKRRTPLHFAIYSKYSIASGWSNYGMCVGILLLAGADPLLIGDRYKETVEDSVKNFAYWFAFGMVNRLVVAQLVILEMQGRRNENNERLFESWYDRQSEIFVDQCRWQLEKLKDQKINDTGELTMFSVITERLEKIANFLDEEDMRTIFTFADCNGNKLMPYYRDLLRQRADDIVWIQKVERWRYRALEYVCRFIGIDDPNHLVVNKIVSYLSAKDLQKFSIERSEKQWSLKVVAKSLTRAAKLFVYRPVVARIENTLTRRVSKLS